MCGGTGIWDGPDPSDNGLSPRVRGNLSPHEAAPFHFRSIPACAGEPITTRQYQVKCEVYPRVCGGTNSITEAIHWRRGLSPRVRGNRRKANQVAHPVGSIPACAGEPTVLGLDWSDAAVYPRVCGGTACIAGNAARWHRGRVYPRVCGGTPSVHP